MVSYTDVTLFNCIYVKTLYQCGEINKNEKMKMAGVMITWKLYSITSHPILVLAYATHLSTLNIINHIFRYFLASITC